MNLQSYRTPLSTLNLSRSYWNVITPTQAIYYNGTQFPDLQNTFIFSTFTGNLYSVALANNNSEVGNVSHILLELSI
jgi:hypothetical protein